MGGMHVLNTIVAQIVMVCRTGRLVAWATRSWLIGAAGIEWVTFAGNANGMTFIGGAPFGECIEGDGSPPSGSEREVVFLIAEEFIPELDPE